MTRSGVAVIVVTYNSQALLADLVRSLPAGAGPDLRWELFVADNDSDDTTVATLHEIAPGCTVVEMGRNAGYAAGINAAVAAAGERDAYLILNPDVRLEPDCLPRLLAAVEAPGVGIAVPRLVDGDGDLILSMRREPSVLRAVGDLVLGAERAGLLRWCGEMVSAPDLYRRARLTDWAEGSTQLITAACWRACGPWDERFFLYSEEADFDLRAGERGFATAYRPEAGAVHLEGGSATSPKLWSLLQMNRVRLFASRHRGVPTAAFWMATVAREASRSLLGHRTSRAALRALLSPTRWREQPGPSWLTR